MKQYTWNFAGDTPMGSYDNREVCINAAREGVENLTRLTGSPSTAMVSVIENDGEEPKLVGIVRACITSTWTEKGTYYV